MCAAFVDTGLQLRKASVAFQFREIRAGMKETSGRTMAQNWMRAPVQNTSKSVNDTGTFFEFTGFRKNTISIKA